jgi:hypothetical protein
MTRALLYCVVLASAQANQAIGQNPAAPGTAPQVEIVDGASYGFSIGRIFLPGDGSLDLAVVGLHVTHLRAEGVASEFSIYTAPEGLALGFVNFAPQWSMMSSRRYGNSWILAKIGVDAVMGFGEGMMGMIPGAHIGVGALLPVAPNAALRLEVQPYWIGLPTAGLPVVYVSVGFNSLPKSRK